MSSPPLVLLVDRDRDSREILRTYLEYRGYAVVEADDARTAVEVAARHRPDVVIGDLPWDSPGPPLLSAALRREIGSDLPVIVYTSRALRRDVEAAAEVGQRVLLKPMSPVDVFLTIQGSLAPDRRRSPS